MKHCSCEDLTAEYSSGIRLLVIQCVCVCVCISSTYILPEYQFHLQGENILAGEKPVQELRFVFKVRVRCGSGLGSFNCDSYV